jgi:tetrahydromethanopterin S-methyltransferase subunit H
MFRFDTQQQTFDIGRVKVGGQPGDNPTVLIGSIFYNGHKIVSDENTGEFDRADAERLIKIQEELSERTRNPFMLDVVSCSKEALKRFVGFVADATEAPFLIDSPSVEVKLAGLEYVQEVGLEKRAVYNSINVDSKLNELEALKNSGVKSAILLAFERGAVTSEVRVKILEKLIPKAKEAGITKPLLDTFVLDIPSLSFACKAILDLKKTYGFPCGCGAHNAISTWAGLKERIDHQSMKAVAAVINAAPAVLGADFILYGPLEDCKYVFP